MRITIEELDVLTEEEQEEFIHKCLKDILGPPNWTVEIIEWEEDE